MRRHDGIAGAGNLLHGDGSGFCFCMCGHCSGSGATAPTLPDGWLWLQNIGVFKHAGFLLSAAGDGGC